MSRLATLLNHLRPLGIALPAVVLIALTTPLGGCITLFPKAEPVTLYRFDGNVTAAPEAAVRTPFSLARAPTILPRAAATDRILTVTGPTVAYISDARWVAPASSLFDEAVERAFANSSMIRLTAMGEPGRPDYLLRLEVLTFETVYVNGAGSAPTVRVQMRASLSNARDRTSAGTQIFTVEVPASENRVSAIVAAYNQATGQVLGELRQWVALRGRPAG